MSELETRTSRTSTLGILAGFLAGAAIGTIATLLLAPRSGAETRRRILDRAERSRDTLERMASAAREGASAAQTAFTTAMHGEEAAHH
jgi:gas vesicle protein